MGPALVLAPMDGITDAPMRALQGETGVFAYAVSEFVRVSSEIVPEKVFNREVPELLHGIRSGARSVGEDSSLRGCTPTGMPVQVQLLGGDPDRMAASALVAVQCGALGIDLNFGCPAPLVNRHDGGASLLRSPCRIRDVVRAVRDAVPPEIPVSAKMRLGWDRIDPIHENARMAAEGGASWITIHARTRVQGYQPPVYWGPIREVRESLGVPVIANGDIWTVDDFRACREATGCQHFMLGRGALADPGLPYRCAQDLGLYRGEIPATDWGRLMRRLAHWTQHYEGEANQFTVRLMKQWLKLAMRFGGFPSETFDRVKVAGSLDEFYAGLEGLALAR